MWARTYFNWIQELLTIIVSAIVFGDHFSLKAGLGLFISIAGILLYNFYRVSLMFHRHREEASSENVAEEIELQEI